ncbi:hypothetical protein [Microvirga sp. M2]|uniref:hypothetical protein n=1 Tax=Microvirga sp. M2 TaxID=3073270 RepID=UPI0039C26228
MARNTGDGSFVLYGMPEAQAESDVIALGFRREISGKWRAHAIEHEFTAGPSGDYLTTVEVKAGEEGKKEEEE